MKKWTILIVLFMLSLTAAVTFGILFSSRDNQVKSLQKQNSSLSAQNLSLQKQAASLSGKINEANSTINQLSTSGSFVDGSPCQTQQLSLSQAQGVRGAAGHRGVVFGYKNTSKQSCTLSGYPGFLALDKNGYVVPDGPIRTGNNYMFQDPSAKSVSIASNETGYFALGWSAATYPKNCIEPTLIESTPPGNLYPLVISVSDFGDDFCNNADLSISTFDKNLSDF